MVVFAEMTAALSLPLALLKAMRPKQWVKNLLLFAGFVFTVNERWHPMSPAMWTYLSRAAAAFALFSLVSSAVYLANDVLDVENDRQHPTKCNRPIASGALPAWLAVLVALLLIPVCLVGAYVLQPFFALAMGGYLVMQVGYLFVLKHIVLLDVFILALGFVIRAVSGAVVIGAVISPWLYTVTLLGSLFLALCKRRGELVLLEGRAGGHRKILEALHAVPARQPDQHRSVVDHHGVLAIHLHVAQIAGQQPDDAHHPVRHLRDVPLRVPLALAQRGRHPGRGVSQG